MAEFLPYSDIAGQVAFALMPAGSKVLDFDELRAAIEKTTGKAVHPEMLRSALPEIPTITYKRGFKKIQLAR